MWIITAARHLQIAPKKRSNTRRGQTNNRITPATQTQQGRFCCNFQVGLTAIAARCTGTTATFRCYCYDTVLFTAFAVATFTDSLRVLRQLLLLLLATFTCCCRNFYCCCNCYCCRCCSLSTVNAATVYIANCWHFLTLLPQTYRDIVAVVTVVAGAIFTATAETLLPCMATAFITLAAKPLEAVACQPFPRRTDQTDGLYIDHIDHTGPILQMSCPAQNLYTTDPTRETFAISCRLCGFHPGKMS